MKFEPKVASVSGHLIKKTLWTCSSETVFSIIASTNFDFEID